MIKVRIRRKPGWKSYQLYFDHPTHGREVSKSAETDNRDEALKAAARWEDELRAERGDREDGWDLFKARFLDEHCIRVAKDTRSACLAALRHYQRLMAPKVIGDVTSDTLSQFAAQLHGEDRPSTTVNQILRHLQVALRFAVRVGMLDRAPHVPMSKIGKRQFMRGRPLTEVEYRKMLRHADAAAGKARASGWRRMLELLWLSGFRIEEAAIASWDDPPVKVELSIKPYPQVLFYAADESIDLEPGQKSGNDESWAMPPDLAEWLAQTPPKKRHGVICPVFGGTGKPVLDANTISSHIAEIGRAAGIVVGQRKQLDEESGQRVKVDRYASAHDLRRAFGLRWAMQVMPVVLQKMMRHKDISTTMKYYVHVSSTQVGDVLWKDCKPTSPATSPRKPKRRA
jgi:integrase